jgi:hypothetical protein
VDDRQRQALDVLLCSGELAFAERRIIRAACSKSLRSTRILPVRRSRQTKLTVTL